MKTNIAKILASLMLAMPLLTLPAKAQLAEESSDKPRDIEAMTKNFTHSLEELGIHAKLRACRMVVTETVTTSRMGNVSYGSYCGISGAKHPDDRVLICYDDMVGHVAISTIYPIDNPNPDFVRAAIDTFVKSHCVGG